MATKATVVIMLVINFLSSSLVALAEDLDKSLVGYEGKRSDIIVLNGIDYRDYMVREALAGYKGGKVSYHNILLDVGLVPKVEAHPESIITANELRKAGVFVIINAPAPSLAPQTQQWLKKNVEDGLRVLILGGLFSFGKGQYENTGLEEIAPVFVNNKWDIKKLDRPLPLEPVQGVAFSEEINWEQKPSVLYYHDDKLKDGAQVWLKAGEVPILVVRKMGKGYTAGFLTAPIGDPPKGVLAYWEWKDWPQLLREVVRKLMEE